MTVIYPAVYTAGYITGEVSIMKTKILALTGATTDVEIIDQYLQELLMDFNVHIRSGPRFIRICIFADISIIIKMLNSFPGQSDSYILYSYLNSSKSHRYLYSQAIQCNIDIPVKEQLKVICHGIAISTVDLIKAYGYKLEHFKIIHNLDDEYMPPAVFYEVPIPQSDDIDVKINDILQLLVEYLDVYDDKAMVKFHYHINKGTEYEVEAMFTLHIQYSEIFFNDCYSLKYKKGEDTMVEYALDINTFCQYAGDALYDMLKKCDYILNDDTAVVKLYFMRNESMEHI